ncbi:MAG TPA: cysteine desulfurase [Lachnospiraceae bacterium]|jgi:cysteine desulfurase|nr:cysteine desulfurase [Butyrivibrio sp. CAG:318]HJI31585.1 cysteine desulfurase [Lachnospiraceae bacterium]
MEIYLDNSATTMVRPEVAKLMYEIMTKDYGNPSSMHIKGVQAERYLREAKEIFAGILKVSEKEIFFTSGGTEGDNMAIIGAALAGRRRGRHIITTVIEHPAVLESCAFLEKNGFEVTYLPVNAAGQVEPDTLKASLRDDTILVSVMYVNNEIGAIEPVSELGRIIKEYNKDILFHVDAVQAFGKFRIHPYKENIDMLTMSSHKIHGPKGVGAIFIKDKTKIQPIALGGGQQKGMRSGTENVPGIAGMAMAAKELYDKFDEDVNRLYELKEYFVREITGIEGATVNGLTGRDSAPHVVSVSFDGITKSEVLLHALEDKGIYISSGSACSSNKPSLSSTLKAIGVKNDLLYATLRFSFSVFTTKEELEYTINAVKELLPVLRKYRPR